MPGHLYYYLGTTVLPTEAVPEKGISTIGLVPFIINASGVNCTIKYLDITL
jgi:hypothetical protein